ncbi:uncharacterized protein BXZ73DRAFT_77127 [Epithele typhae]|uniref:uncharacterized protein n=1 Tax=Epithele typhae TaxID=378194 RepID=UPI0020088E6E|nr:uncharacterized protein BXZ73DRAFT_77127 [Epithele typhae]KAH9934032.1 hypothetical protein BXZ73DRAFT_77127 [Epithele typhae]
MTSLNILDSDGRYVRLWQQNDRALRNVVLLRTRPSMARGMVSNEIALEWCHGAEDTHLTPTFPTRRGVKTEARWRLGVGERVWNGHSFVGEPAIPKTRVERRRCTSAMFITWPSAACAPDGSVDEGGGWNESEYTSGRCERSGRASSGRGNTREDDTEHTQELKRHEASSGIVTVVSLGVRTNAEPQFYAGKGVLLNEFGRGETRLEVRGTRSKTRRGAGEKDQG